MIIMFLIDTDNQPYHISPFLLNTFTIALTITAKMPIVINHSLIVTSYPPRLNSRCNHHHQYHPFVTCLTFSPPMVPRMIKKKKNRQSSLRYTSVDEQKSQCLYSVTFWGRRTVHAWLMGKGSGVWLVPYGKTWPSCLRMKP